MRRTPKKINGPVNRSARTEKYSTQTFPPSTAGRSIPCILFRRTRNTSCVSFRCCCIARGQCSALAMAEAADQPEPRLAIPRKWRTEFSTCNTLRSKARRGSIHDNSTGAKSKAKNVYIPVSLHGTVDPLEQRITHRGSRRPRHSQERQHSDQTPSSRSRDPASVTAAPLHSRTSPPTAPWRQPPSGSRHLRCR